MKDLKNGYELPEDILGIMCACACSAIAGFGSGE